MDITNRYIYLATHYDSFPYFAIISPVPTSTKHLHSTYYKCLTIGCRVRAHPDELPLLTSPKGYAILLLGTCMRRSSFFLTPVGHASNCPSAVLFDLTTMKILQKPCAVRFLSGFSDPAADRHAMDFKHSLSRQELIDYAQNWRNSARRTEKENTKYVLSFVSFAEFKGRVAHFHM